MTQFEEWPEVSFKRMGKVELPDEWGYFLDHYGKSVDIHLPLKAYREARAAVNALKGASAEDLERLLRIASKIRDCLEHPHKSVSGLYIGYLREALAPFRRGE